MPQRLLNMIPARVVVLGELLLVVLAWVESLEVYIRIGSGIIAILVGIAAIMHYLSKIRLNNREATLKEIEIQDALRQWADRKESKRKPDA